MDTRTILLLRALALAVLAVLLGCQRQAEPEALIAEADAGDGPTQESWGVAFNVTEDGHPRVQMVAPYLAEYETPDSTYLLLTAAPGEAGPQVTAHLYDAAGLPSATVTADRLYYHELDRRFEARGNVVVVTADDERLESEHLTWDEAERRIATPGFVRITTAEERIQGYGLSADEDLETYELSRVTGQVTIREEDA